MSYEEDKNMCDAFVAEGAVFPKVLPEEVQKLFETLRFETHVVPNTTTTVCSAVLPIGACDFVIATGETACIDKRNFNPVLGEKYAKEKCELNARNKLWELEGYYKAKLLADKAGDAGEEETHS